MAHINPENGFSRGRALANNRWPTVQEDAPPHYWGGDCSYWSIVKPLATDVTNQVANPSFERDIDGWTTSTGAVPLVRSQFGVVGGYRGTATPPPGSGAYSVIYGPNFAVSALPQAVVNQNRTMYGCVWVRAKAGNTLRVNMIYDGIFGGFAPYAIVGEQTTVQATGQWQRICCSFTATALFPTGITQWPLALQIETDNAAGGNLDVDAAIMSESIESSYFDGDAGNGFTWAGASHASFSTASRFSRTYGTEINFADLGIDIYADAGWGHAPVENITTSFAQLNGSHFQRQRLLPRTLTLTAAINACCSVTQVHKARKALIDAMTYAFYEICTEEMLLTYQVRSECCGALSVPIGILVSYQAGLEGLRTNPYFEKLALQFVSNNDPTFFDIYETNVVLSPANLTGTSIQATGNAPMYPIIELRAGANPVTINRVINDTGQYGLALGVPNVGYTLPANNYLIIDTDPRSFSATLYPSNTSLMSQINFPGSNVVGRAMMLPGFNSWRADWGTPNVGQELLIRWRNRFLSADSLYYLNGCGTCCPSGGI